MARSRIRHSHGRMRRWRGIAPRISGREACRRLEEYPEAFHAVPEMYEQGSTPRLMKLEELYSTSVMET